MKVTCPKCKHVFLTKGNTTKLVSFLQLKNKELRKTIKKLDRGKDKKFAESDFIPKYGVKISTISKALNISRPAVYHHVNKLCKLRVVEISKPTHLRLKGNPTFVKIRPNSIKFPSKAKLNITRLHRKL